MLLYFRSTGSRLEKSLALAATSSMHPMGTSDLFRYDMLEPETASGEFGSIRYLTSLSERFVAKVFGLVRYNR